jgi:glycosyltransferase involved in cell wall biosynthesis
MKILYHHRIGSKDGQYVHIEELIAALRRMGNEVIVVEPGGFSDTSFGNEPKAIDTIKKLLPKALYEVLEFGYNLPAYLRLRRACRAHRPDAIYERYNLYMAAGIMAKRACRIPLLLEVNSPLARERAETNGLGLPWFARAVERFVWRNADYVLPVTQVLASEIAENGVSTQSLRVIPNGIDEARFAIATNRAAERKRLGLSDKIVIGFVGFIREWHGLEAVIEWLAQPTTPRDLHLFLIGDGPARPKLADLGKQLGVADRITFTGIIGRADIARAMDVFDIALQAKANAYASPLKLFEYMVLGKAIVAPDQPNIREVLTPEQSALLFDPDNTDAMTTAIHRLAQDTGLRARLGEEAQRAVAVQKLTWDENARRVTALMEQARSA